LAQRSVSPWSALGGKHALNWRTHVVFALPVSITGLLNDFGRLGGDPISWLLVVVAGFAITVFAIELLEQFYTRLFGRPNSWINLLILGIAGLIRGLTVFNVGTLLGVMPASEIWFRLFAAPLYVVAIYMVFNTLVVAYLTQKEVDLELRREQYSLNQSRLEFAQEIDRLRLAQRSRISEMVTPSLWEISKHLSDARLSKDASAIVRALRGLNEDVVRPLSHELAKRFDPPTLTAAAPFLTKLGRLTLPKRSTLGQTLAVGWTALTSFVLGFSMLSASSNPLQGFTTALVLTSWFGLVTYGVKALTANLEHPTWLGFLASIPTGAIVGLTAWPFTFWDTLTLPAAFMVQSTLFFSIAYPSIYLMAVAQNQSEISQAQLRNIVEELRLLNSQLRQQVWLDQKMLATELHGSVQATLHATALQLSKIEQPSIADLEKVRDAVDKAIARLGQTAYLEGEDFSQVIADIAEVWADTCQIEYHIQPAAQQALDGQQSLARSTVEVLREAITNAIKHGKAKNIKVTITQSGQLLDLIVDNDGEEVSAGEQGLGTNVIAELTHSHRLYRTGDGVRFTAAIALGLQLEQ
jgi:signal transduction histidine kinase